MPANPLISSATPSSQPSTSRISTRVPSSARNASFPPPALHTCHPLRGERSTGAGWGRHDEHVASSCKRQRQPPMHRATPRLLAQSSSTIISTGPHDSLPRHRFPFCLRALRATLSRAPLSAAPSLCCLPSSPSHGSWARRDRRHHFPMLSGKSGSHNDRSYRYSSTWNWSKEKPSHSSSSTANNDMEGDDNHQYNNSSDGNPSSSIQQSILAQCSSLHSSIMPINSQLSGPLAKNSDRGTSLPFVFLVGNHSSGKSSFINYVLGRSVQTAGGAHRPPTTALRSSRPVRMTSIRTGQRWWEIRTSDSRG